MQANHVTQHQQRVTKQFEILHVQFTWKKLRLPEQDYQFLCNLQSLCHASCQPSTQVGPYLPVLTGTLTNFLKIITTS